MAVPPGSCSTQRERNLGPLHEPVWLNPPPERSPLAPVPPVIVQPRAYQMGMARVPGPLHEASWEPQAETSSLPGRMPSSVPPAGGGPKWKGKSVGPLHEPVWDQLPLSGPLPPQSLPPGCTQKGRVTQGDPHKPPFLVIPPCFCEKGKERASYPGSSRTTVACSSCQPTAPEKGKDRFLHPPHDPVWYKLPLGSARLEATPPTGIPPVSCLKEREKPAPGLHQHLPLGSSHLVQPPSVAVPPCICLKMAGGFQQDWAGGLHPSASSLLDRTSSRATASGSSQQNLGPLHEPVWSQASQASSLQGETPSGSVQPGPLGTLHEPVSVDQPDSLSFQGQTPLGSVQAGTLHEPVFCHFPGGTVQIPAPLGSAQHEGTLHEPVYYHYPGGTLNFEAPLGNVHQGHQGALHEPVHQHVPGCPAGQAQTPHGSVQQGHRGTLHEPVQPLLQSGSSHVRSTPAGSVQKGKHSALHEPVSWD